jgi:hypothetical protein
MNIEQVYIVLKGRNIPSEIILNSILVNENIIDGYFLSFKKYNKKYKQNIYDVIDSITYNLINIRINKYSVKGILFYHNKNILTYDKITFNQIKNYLNHPKVYNNIQYGIKFTLNLENNEIFKTVSYNNSEDINDFKIKLNQLKNKIEEITQKLKIYQLIQLRIEDWYSKNYLINQIKEGLNFKQKNYLIKLLKSSKFEELSNILELDNNLINKYKSELLLIISYIKTHNIIQTTSEIQNWEKIIIENIIMKDGH